MLELSFSEQKLLYFCITVLSSHWLRLPQGEHEPNSKLRDTWKKLTAGSFQLTTLFTVGQQVLPWRGFWVTSLCICHNPYLAHRGFTALLCIRKTPACGGRIYKRKVEAGIVSPSPTPLSSLQVVLTHPFLPSSFQITISLSCHLCWSQRVAYLLLYPQLPFLTDLSFWSPYTSKASVLHLLIHSYNWARKYQRNPTG